LLTDRKRETTGNIAPYRCCIWASRRSEKGSSLDHGRETNEPSAPERPAALDVATPVGIPATFTLAIPGDGLHFRLPSPLAQAKWDPD
jgi:hypothetical protein